MKQAIVSLSVSTRRGLVEVTKDVREAVRAQKMTTGLCTVFIKHTSASLVIQENADPAVQRDLERFLSRLAPDDESLYEHTAEGPDDMPAHVKAALTKTSEQIPIVDGELSLGTWQGIYVWEHRDGRHRRELVLHILGG